MSTFDAEPAFADRHLIYVWAGMRDLTEMDTPELFIHLFGVSAGVI